MSPSYFINRDHCPACKSRKSTQIYSCPFDAQPIRQYLESFYLPQGSIEFEYLKHAQFTLIECHNCSLIYQYEVPNTILLEKIYEDWIDPVKALAVHKDTMTLDDTVYYAREIMPIIAYFDTVPSKLKFLDFGMGWGTWCKLARAFGCECYGTELSDTRIQHAQSEGIKVIPWEYLPNHTFHFINTEQVFEHLPEPFETLVYLKTCLHSHGLLKISVPNAVNIKKRLKIADWNAPKHSRNSLNPVAPLEHINSYTYKSIINMATLAGFRKIKLPLRLQYEYSIYGTKPTNIFKRIIKPLYNKIIKNTYVFFSHKSP